MGICSSVVSGRFTERWSCKHAQICSQSSVPDSTQTSLVWGTVIAWIGSLALAASLAEMASMNPTVGAQYRWTSRFAPRGFGSPAFWGLLQGWITVFAWITTCAQPAFLLGTLIQGLIVLDNDNYAYERWHGTFLAWAIFAVPIIINIFARKLLPSLEVIGGITHIVFFIAWVVTLAALAPRSSAEFVFATNSFGLSGWSNEGVQWCVGLLSAVFPLGGFDGVLHMSDEVKDAEKKVPMSMVLGLAINGAMSFAFMITILFCLGDPEVALTTPTGYPIIQVAYGATGSKAATIALCSFIIWNGMIAMFSSLASVSRLTWAFARDNGLPFSSFFGYVHPTLRIPLNALGLVSTVIVILQVINIGSSTALFAILGLSTIGLYLSYVLPVLFIVIAKLRGERIDYGPFKLGAAGLPINIFAVVYGIFILIWLPFPPFMPVTGTNMNYAGPIMGALLLAALADWFITGKRRFKVPVESQRPVDY
jgi:choline transport protein